MKKSHYCVFAAVIAALASPAAMAANEPAPAAPVKASYSTDATPLGDLLDNSAAKAVLEKYIPAIINNDSIAMARGMTLKALQSYAGDALNNQTLAAIDVDLSKIAAK